MRNARFWVWWHCEWVKLTLEPGQDLSATCGGRHEEGWSYTSKTWRHDGDRVIRETTTNASDCDGRIDFYQDDFCLLENLKAEEPFLHEDAEIRVPAWERLSASQRDHEAERAGY